MTHAFRRKSAGQAFLLAVLTGGLAVAVHHGLAEPVLGPLYPDHPHAALATGALVVGAALLSRSSKAAYRMIWVLTGILILGAAKVAWDDLSQKHAAYTAALASYADAKGLWDAQVAPFLSKLPDHAHHVGSECNIKKGLAELTANKPVPPIAPSVGLLAVLQAVLSSAGLEVFVMLAAKEVGGRLGAAWALVLGPLFRERRRRAPKPQARPTVDETGAQAVGADVVPLRRGMAKLFGKPVTRSLEAEPIRLRRNDSK